MSLSTSAQSQDWESLATAAITAALTANWQEAIKLNVKILTQNRTNVEALNRLARAYSCLGQIQKAQNIYKKVIEIDPYNIIALKNMEKLAKTATNGHTSPNSSMQASLTGSGLNLSQVFLDEPGKTKLVNLLNLAPPSVLAALNCGDKLIINPKNHAISVASGDGTYLGAFPDDLAHRLLAFIAGGNTYEAFVKSASTKNLIIFVRETLRSAKFGNQPSFATHVSLFDEDAKTR